MGVFNKENLARYAEGTPWEACLPQGDCDALLL